MLRRAVRPCPFILLVVLASVFVACSSSAASRQPSADPAGSPSSPASARPSGRRITVTEKGFGLTLPEGWQRLPTDQAALDSALQGLPKDSYLRGFLQGQFESMATVDLWAYIAGEPNGDLPDFRTLSVATAPSADLDLTALEPTLRSQFAAMEHVEGVETAIVTLPVGKAIRVTFAVTTGTTDPKLLTTQYYVPLGDNVAVVTFVAYGDAGHEFEDIIGSLEATS